MRDAWLPEPDLESIDIQTVLAALADPVRLRIVRQLDAVAESTCTALDMPVKVSTVSHHVGVLRECGVVSTRVDGNARPSRLRREDLQRRFPGLLDAIVRATPPSAGAGRMDPAGSVSSMDPMGSMDRVGSPDEAAS